MTPPEHSTLHLSQKVFWFSASISLLVATFVFSWRVYQGQNASIEMLGMKVTSETAEKSVAATRDRLLTLRTRLSEATEADASNVVQEVVPELDELLRTLGVAEAALKKQQQSPVFGSGSWYDYGRADDSGFGKTEGDYFTPSPAPTRGQAPRRK